MLCRLWLYLVTMLISGGALCGLFVLAIYIASAGAAPGDKAFAACRDYGQSMPECGNILRPAKRQRVRVDRLLFPHMVLLGYGDKSPARWKCGGSLVSATWVLTAAHCLHDPVDGPVRIVRVGTATFEFDEEEDLMQERNVSARVPHPLYKPPSKYHDIALVKADPPFALSRDIRIACLQVEPYIPNSNATAIGFGTTRSGSTKTSETLMRVEVDLVDSGVCNDTLKPLIRRGYLSSGLLSGQLCAGDLERGGRDTCQGDSGGPLQYFPDHVDCKKIFPLHYVAGVTSFGRHCGFRRAPGVYTRVSHYTPWVEAVVWPQQ